MIRDLRTPSLVVTGAWNPAIFQPGWIASNLLGIPKGEKGYVAQYVMPDDNGNPKLISFFGDVGISALEHRFEIFLNSDEEKTAQKGESIIKKVLETLPHTPVEALGVNFLFFESAASGEIIDKIQTKEGLEAKYRIKQHNFTSTLSIEDDTDFNFFRTVNDQGVRFSLNFHTLVGSESFKNLEGLIQQRLKFSLNFLQETYGTEVEGKEAFPLPPLKPTTGDKND